MGRARPTCTPWLADDLRSGHRLHELAGRLRQVLRCAYLALILHDAATETMRLHVLESADPAQHSGVEAYTVAESSAGLVWQTRRPLVTSNADELTRWTCHTGDMGRLGVQSICVSRPQ